MFRLAAFLVSIVGIAAPAAALDLTGTWEGRFTCSEFDDEGPFRFAERGQTFRISQTDNDVRVEWVGDPTFTLTGLAIPDASNPDAKGEVALADCSTAADLFANYSELARLAVRIDREKGKGSLKGLTIYGAGGLTVGSCKASFKPVDTADPEVGGCP